jgi:hypothetical protein
MRIEMTMVKLEIFSHTHEVSSSLLSHPPKRLSRATSSFLVWGTNTTELVPSVFWEGAIVSDRSNDAVLRHFRRVVTLVIIMNLYLD